MRTAVPTDPDAIRTRRYLLRQASEEQSAEIEQEYLQNEEALARMEAAEEDLIEAYLAERLDPDERLQFERSYLASSRHRRRVESIRQLMAQSADAITHRSAPSRDSWPRRGQWLAAAAVLIAAIAVSWLLVGRRGDDSRVAESGAPAVSPTVPERATEPSPDTRPRAPRVVAFSLSPLLVRSAAEPATLIIPPATDEVVLRLEGDGSRVRLSRARVVIRTVAGEEVWQGPATMETGAARRVLARVSVPAARLVTEDYIVILFGAEAAAPEQEWHRYFLRVRAR